MDIFLFRAQYHLLTMKAREVDTKNGSMMMSGWKDGRDV